MNAIITKNVSPFQAKINVKKKVDNIHKKLLTTSEQEALMDLYNKSNINIDAIVLTVLHQKYGFTAEQLKDFYDEVVSISKAELEANHDVATYGEVPQVQALKDELGIDIVAWDEGANADG